jgi:tRNA wybutosine-synthesizing protein 2
MPNIVLNHVTSIVQPLLGDNRSVAPRNIADRVIMGCIRNTQTFLPLAFECLKEDGFIHYHNLCPTDSTDKLYQDISQVANHYGKEAKVLALKRIKSYAPGIDHYVLDVKVI